jgi:uncharacterized protein (TIGR00369 family)
VFEYGKYLKRLQEGDSSINPFLAFMGMTLDALGHGSARFRMPVRREFIQGAGVVQGGLIVAMASETIAHAVMTLLEPGEGIATIELKNNFLASIKNGEVIADATVFKKGGRVIIGDCLVSSAFGKDLSRTTSSILLLPSSHA